MYIYQAELWCNDCGKAICRKLKRDRKAPEDPDDETSFDSDDYPKRTDDNEESDGPQHSPPGSNALTRLHCRAAGRSGYCSAS